MRSYRNLKNFAAGATIAAAFGAFGMLGWTLYLYNAASQVQPAAGASANAGPNAVVAEAAPPWRGPRLVGLRDSWGARP